MKRLAAVAAVLLAVTAATSGCSKPEKDVALARIKAVGGTISYDAQGRVISVDLSDSWATDEEVAAIRYLPYVETINCTNARRITGSTLHQLAALPKLNTLYLVGTQLDDAGLAQLQHATSLTTLNLDSTRITDAGMRTLDNLDNLQTLVLGHTAVTDRGLVQLRDLRQLSTLNLRDTKTTPDGVKGLRRMLPDVRIVQSPARVSTAACPLCHGKSRGFARGQPACCRRPAAIY
jgi:hypothetical protein